MRIVKVLLVVTALSFAIGCGPDKSAVQNTKIQGGVVATPGVSIKAVSGGFVLESGKEFQTPFSIKWGVHNRFQRVQYGQPRNSQLINKYNDALSLGAQEVRVTVPYFGKKLYGILSLVDVWSGNSSAGARSYRIEIPESYALAALDGKISVVYESIPDEYFGGSETDLTWVLWLSDKPFPKE